MVPRNSKSETSPVALVGGGSPWRPSPACGSPHTTPTRRTAECAHVAAAPPAMRARRERLRTGSFSSRSERLMTGYCRNWWFRLEREGLVPKRIKLGPKRVGWLESELQAWLQERAAARDGGGDADATA